MSRLDDDMQRLRCLRTLRLSTDATPDQIHAAYRRLCKVWHPDRFQHDEALREEAETALREINAAYEYLRSANDEEADRESGDGALEEAECIAQKWARRALRLQYQRPRDVTIEFKPQRSRGLNWDETVVWRLDCPNPDCPWAWELTPEEEQAEHFVCSGCGTRILVANGYCANPDTSDE
jgi:hypothetical protein